MSTDTAAAPDTVQRLREAWTSRSPLVRDGLGAIALMVLSLLPLGIDGVRLGELQRELPSWAPVLLIAAQTLPLAVRRTAPAVALAAIGIAFGATQVLGAGTGLAGLGLLFALYAAGAHLRRGRLAVIASIAAGYLVLVALLIAQNSPERPIDWITFVAVLVVPWAAGDLMRRRRAEHAVRLERAAADADRAARSLLARELHDIVTHHVTAMVVQAESAGYLPDTAQGTTERDTILASVGSTGRLALTELRSLLGALDPGAASNESTVQSPCGLAEAGEIERMVARLRETGYPITLQARGPVDAIPTEAVAVMRSVAREAVTNAMKHARGQAVQLTITATAHAAELTVVNDIAPDAQHAHPEQPRAGRGTSGMGIRVAESGGVFTTAVRDGQYIAMARWER